MPVDGRCLTGSPKVQHARRSGEVGGYRMFQGIQMIYFRLIFNIESKLGSCFTSPPSGNQVDGLPLVLHNGLRRRSARRDGRKQKVVQNCYVRFSRL